MQIDIYHTPPEILFKNSIHYSTFFSRMKAVNKEFNKNLLTDLFIALTGNINNKLTYKKMFENFNVYNKSLYSYLNIYENIEKITKIYANKICNDIPFLELKKALLTADSKCIGKLNYNAFFPVINNLLKEKISSQDFVHFLRINKLIELNNEIDYINFLRFIDSKYPDKSFIQCLNILVEFLEKECNKDIFIFTIKINNMNNNSSSNEIINPERLYYICKEKNEFLKFETIKKFDYNEDGIISINDIKFSIIKYYDSHFFDKKEIIEENKKKEEENKLKKIITNFYIYIIELLKKNNLTENNFFLYLDKNQDELIDKEEFIRQLSSLQFFENEKYGKHEIEIFFNFLDEFKTNKINLDTFQNKFRFLKDEVEKENKNNNLIKKKRFHIRRINIKFFM